MLKELVNSAAQEAYPVESSHQGFQEVSWHHPKGE